MLEGATNNWAAGGLPSVFDVTNLLPFVTNYWEKDAIRMESTKNSNVKSSDVLLGYLILFWAMLYLVYEKCLNSLLRRMRFPLIQRIRIIEAAWSCGFCFGSICYFNSPTSKTLSFTPREGETSRPELGLILYKSFYFHRAALEILSHGAWIKGWANFLFASFILNLHQQKWSMIANTFLLYKAADTVLINACQIALSVFQNTGRKIAKTFFFIHCLNWIYLYIFYVPKTMLCPEDLSFLQSNGGTELGLWIWFGTECLDSVCLRLLGCAKATHWLELCIFPPPTREAIELASIQRRHRDSLKKSVNARPKKTELWHTLLCAMAIKKKIKRIRQAKQNESVSAEKICPRESSQDRVTEDVCKGQ